MDDLKKAGPTGPSSFNITLDALTSLFNYSNLASQKAFESLQNIGGPDGLMSALHTSPTHGIDEKTVQSRAKQYGENRLKKKEIISFSAVVKEETDDITLRILTVVAVISLIVGTVRDPAAGWIEGIVLLVAVSIAIGLTSIVSYYKEQRYASNASNNQAVVTVIRNGSSIALNSEELVTGDIVKIRAGNCIPADGVLLGLGGVMVDEVSVTGGGGLVKKGAFSLKSPPESSPFLISGSKIASGSGLLLVCLVGPNSYMSKAPLPEEDLEQSKMERNLETLAEKIGTYGFLVALAAFVVRVAAVIVAAIVRGEWGAEGWHGLFTSFIIAIAMLIVAVPESLPTFISLSMAVSMKRIARDNAAIKRLKTCEKMATVTDVCIDLSNVLRPSQDISIASLDVSGRQYSQHEFATLRTDSIFAILSEFCWDIGAFANGEEMEEVTGLMVSALKEVKETPLLFIPFSPTRQYAVILSHQRILCLQGNPERLISLCAQKYHQGGVQSFTSDEKERVRNQAADYGSKGLRVVALAYKPGEVLDPDQVSLGGQVNEAYLSEDLAFLGILVINTFVPPYNTESIRLLQDAGVSVKLVTSESRELAVTVAKQCGILSVEPTEGEVMEGGEFAKGVGLEAESFSPSPIINDLSAFQRISNRLLVLARCLPQQKLGLVNGLRQVDRTAAVTGCSITDVAALRKAEVSLAQCSPGLGLDGWMAACEVADVTLTVGRTDSIVTVLKYSRGLIFFLRKLILFQSPLIFSALTISLIGSVFAYCQLLTAVQLIWISLLMNTVASFALASESPSSEILKDGPWTGELVTKEMTRMINSTAAYQISWLLVILIYGPHLFAVPAGWEQTDWTQAGGRHFTMLFHAFVFLQIFHLLSCREGFSSRLTMTAAGTAAVQIAIVQFGGAALRCSQLAIAEHAYCIAIGLSSLPFFSIVKWLTADKIAGGLDQSRVKKEQ